MLISNRHKFIFIHVPKVAGQSITNALYPYCAGAFQHKISSLVTFRTQLKINTKLRHYFGFGCSGISWDDHVSMSELSEDIGPSIQNYFSFAFVRNPWDWVLSNYKYALKNPRHHRHRFVKYECASFDDYVTRLYGNPDRKDYNQSNFIYDQSDRLLVDYVGRMENLETDFGQVCDRIGISVDLPRLNRSQESKYRECYTEKTRDIVAHSLTRDIENLGYEF